jgi:hypothetical protein
LGKKLLKRVLNHKLDKEQAFFAWGSYFVDLIKKEINDGNNFKPNAEITIMKKGEGKHPLQDTMRLRNSIKAVVKDGV